LGGEKGKFILFNNPNNRPIRNVVPIRLDASFGPSTAVIAPTGRSAATLSHQNLKRES